MYTSRRVPATDLSAFFLFGWWAFGIILPTNESLAAPIDEFRISDLEQRIRELESSSREQARLIAQLQTQSGTSRGNAMPATSSRRAPDISGQQWLHADRWQHLTTNMNELQVIELLGVPTQVRMSADGRTRSLLYAMEVGRSGFLGGRVEMRDGKVSTIEQPRLK